MRVTRQRKIRPSQVMRITIGLKVRSQQGDGDMVSLSDIAQSLIKLRRAEKRRQLSFQLDEPLLPIWINLEKFGSLYDQKFRPILFHGVLQQGQNLLSDPPRLVPL